MAPKVIELGQNAFVSDKRDFSPVNTDREKKSLQKQGQWWMLGDVNCD